MMAKGNNSEKNTGMKNFKILRLLDLKIDWQAMDIMSKRQAEFKTGELNLKRNSR